jgi:NitT/TauT family transport system permease protein
MHSSRELDMAEILRSPGMPAETVPRPVALPAPARPSRWWSVRAAIPARARALLALAGLVLPLALWWAGTAGRADGAADAVFLPSPAQVWSRLADWWLAADLAGDMRVSVGRVLGGFLLSAVIALPLGLMIGSFRVVQALLEPLTDFIRYMPAVAFIPLVMLWVGIEESSKVAIIFIGTFFQMVLMVAEDVRRVPLAQIEAAQTLGATRTELIEKVIFPSAAPALLDTMRVTMGWAWTYLVVAELVAANSGLGYAILKAQRFLQTDKIFAGILLIGLIGLLTDQLFRWAHRRAFPWLHLKG